MITEKNHKLLTSQIFLTDCTKKRLASMHVLIFLSYNFDKLFYEANKHYNTISFMKTIHE
jgi:hypothetical protein